MTSLELLELWSTRVGISLVHVMWQGAVVGAVMFILLSLLRGKSPGLRYALAASGLLLMLALPVVNFLAISPIGLEAGSSAVALESEVSSPPDHAMSAPVPAPPMAAPVVVSVGEESAPTPAPTASAPLPEWPERPAQVVPGIGQRIAPWLTYIWALGVLLLGLRDMAGVVVVRRLRRTARPVEAEIMAMVEFLRDKIGLTRRVVVRWSSDIDSAVAIGWFSPAILLPVSLATGVPPAALQAILAHELAHIQRHDVWVNLFQRFAETFLFFHPVVWWLSREMRKERELCCDDIAVAHCGDRVQYVHGLLAMAEAGHPAAALAVSARGGDLAERVARILHPAVQADATIRPLAGVGALSLLLMPLALAFVALSAQAAEESVASTLQFPHRSVGTVFVRWMGEEYRQQSWLPGHNEGWTVLAPAQGDVLVPEDCHVRLQTKETNLEFLRALAPDSLFGLDCQAAALSDAQLAPIAHLTGLRALDLSLNREITDAGIDQLGGLSELEWLGIEKTAITGKDTRVFEGFRKLVYFDAFSSQFSNEGLLQLSTLPKLEWLGLENSKGIPDTGPLHIGKMKTLKGINLEKGRANDTFLLELGDMPNLEYLSLRNNSITDQGLRNMGAYPALKVLSLSKTLVTDTWICELSKMGSLQNLNLELTGVTMVCKDDLLSVPQLSSVALSQTSLSEADQREINGALASRAIESAPVQSSSNSNAPKVGLYLSHFTATGPSPTGHPAGYHHQHSREIFRMLNEANYDVYAVIEPDTELLGELPALLLELGLSRKTLDATDVSSLGTLDVLFSATSRHVPDEVLAAFDLAITGGVGYVNIAELGLVAPGMSASQVERLTGLKNSELAWMGFDSFPCQVVGSHPILGNIKPGTKISIPAMSGNVGTEKTVVNGQVLMADAEGFPATFFPMYVREHGQGRIVRCQWFRIINTELPFGQYGLYLRSINWAAKRDVESVW